MMSLARWSYMVPYWSHFLDALQFAVSSLYMLYIVSDHWIQRNDFWTHSNAMSHRLICKNLALLMECPMYLDRDDQHRQYRYNYASACNMHIKLRFIHYWYAAKIIILMSLPSQVVCNVLVSCKAKGTRNHLAARICNCCIVYTTNPSRTNTHQLVSASDVPLYLLKCRGLERPEACVSEPG